MKPENIDPTPEEQWDHLAAEPMAWHESAWVLKDCAKIIGERFVADLLSRTPPEGKTTTGLQPISYGPVFQMLAGYALEDLLKAILIALDPSRVKDHRRWKEFTSGHNLSAMCDLAGIKLEEPQRRFLDRLTDAVKWVGRYPVTKRRDEMKRSKYSEGTDLDRFLRFYDRLYQALLKARRPREGGR